MDAIEELLRNFNVDNKSVSTPSQTEELHVKYLGRNGLVNAIMQKIKDVPADQKKLFGQKLNQLKKEIQSSLDKRHKDSLKSAGDTAHIDVTLPGQQYPKGSLHLVSYAVEEISRIFQKIGFIRMTYPEVEWEFFSFDALNMGKDEPARDEFETFFVNAPPSAQFGKMLLSMHTSSGQVREMWRLNSVPPIRMLSIGKCYRPNWDTSHTPMFHQLEILCVDKHITIANLKGTISYFVKEFFGEEREVRLRPHHFQFTEPSFEVDITCDICNGTGFVSVIPSTARNPRILRQAQDDLKVKCRVCKSGWLELAGAGMVHPNVLKAGKIDSKQYSGFAFAFGLERIMMMKEGLKLDDMRVLYNGDIRFLEQF